MFESNRAARLRLRPARRVVAGDQRAGNFEPDAQFKLRCGGRDYFGSWQYRNCGTGDEAWGLRFYRKALIDREDSADRAQCSAAAPTRIRE